MEVLICKADPLHGDDPIEDVTIQIIEAIGEGRTLSESKVFFESQAQKLAEALFKSLPQGTRERLLIYLMQQSVSSYYGR